MRTNPNEANEVKRFLSPSAQPQRAINAVWPLLPAGSDMSRTGSYRVLVEIIKFVLFLENTRDDMADGGSRTSSHVPK